VRPLASYGPNSLAAARICVHGAFLVQMALTDFYALGQLPTTIMHPPGIMEYLSWKFYDRLVTPAGMVALQCALIVSLAASTLGLLGRLSCATSAALVILYQGILRSFGHFNHDEMVGVICLVILAFSPCCHALAIGFGQQAITRPPSVAYGYPLFLMQAVMAWAYFSSALLKLRLGGLAWFSTESLPVLAIQHSLDNLHDTQFTLAFFLAQYRHLAPLGAIGAVAWELSFPLCLVWQRSKWIILPIGVLFHIGTMLLVNITFYNQVAMYLIFVDWEQVLKRLTRQPSISQR
jgi:hypothetical protein